MELSGSLGGSISWFGLSSHELSHHAGGVHGPVAKSTSSTGKSEDNVEGLVVGRVGEVSEDSHWSTDHGDWELENVGDDVEDISKESNDGVDVPAKDESEEGVPEVSWPVGDIVKIGGDWVDSISVKVGVDDTWSQEGDWPELPEGLNVVSVIHILLVTYNK